MSTVSAKLRYLNETKRLIKGAIQSQVNMPDDTVFRKYPDYIKMCGGIKINKNPKVVQSEMIAPSKVVVIPSITHRTEVMYE